MPTRRKPKPLKLTNAEIASALCVLAEAQRAVCHKIFGQFRLGRLLGEFQLTPAQTYRLAHVPRKVKQDLTHSAPPANVRDELESLATDLRKASRRVVRWHKLNRPSQGPEALGHLNRAHQLLLDGPADGTWPERIVGSEIIKLAAQLAERALELAPMPGTRRAIRQKRGGQATSVPASASAIEWIVEALYEPDDPESRQRAAALPARPTSRTSGAFHHLAELIFATALGTGDAEVNPSRSISAYVERQRMRVA